MGEFNVEGRWPELFEGLSVETRQSVLNTLASSWHEGWVPNRDDVRDLTDYARGTIDRAEYDRRSRAAADEARTGPAVS